MSGADMWFEVRPGSGRIQHLAEVEDFDILESHRRLRPLLQVYETWCSEQQGRQAIPQRLPAGTLSRAQMLGNTHIYDVTPERPDDYLIIWWGRNAAINNRRDTTFETPGQIPWPRYREWVGAGLREIKDSGRPQLQYVSTRWITGTVSRHRLLLPFSDDGTRTDRVLMAWVYASFDLVK